MGIRISYQSLQGKTSEGGLSAAQRACMQVHTAFMLDVVRSPLGWNIEPSYVFTISGTTSVKE